MKRLLFILSLAVLAGCSREAIPSAGIAVPSASESVSARPIRFCIAGTRAVSEIGLSDLRSAGFNVCAATCRASASPFYADAAQYFNLQASYDSSEDAFVLPALYYFPKADDMMVFASNADIPVTFKAGSFATDCGFAVSDPWTKDVVVAQTAWEASSGSRSSALGLSFRHVLSQMAFSAKGAVSGLTYNVSGITVSTRSAGSWYFFRKSGSTYESNVWVLSGSNADRAHFTAAVPTGCTSGTFSPVGESISYFPGTWTVTVSYEVLSGSVSLGSYAKSFNVTLEAGKRHLFNLTLPAEDTDSIYFSVSIQDWVDKVESVSL